MATRSRLSRRRSGATGRHAGSPATVNGDGTAGDCDPGQSRHSDGVPPASSVAGREQEGDTHSSEGQGVVARASCETGKGVVREGTKVGLGGTDGVGPFADGQDRRSGRGTSIRIST